jgi:hypothetical protein
LVITRLDTAVTNLFLAELGQAVAPGVHGIVPMDKAGGIRAAISSLPEDLSLAPAALSLELNSIERLMAASQRQYLSHCVFRKRSLTPTLRVASGMR